MSPSRVQILPGPDPPYNPNIQCKIPKRKKQKRSMVHIPLPFTPSIWHLVSCMTVHFSMLASPQIRHQVQKAQKTRNIMYSFPVSSMVWRTNPTWHLLLLFFPFCSFSFQSIEHIKLNNSWHFCRGNNWIDVLGVRSVIIWDTAFRLSNEHHIVHIYPVSLSSTYTSHCVIWPLSWKHWHSSY